jgi:YggT family protein
MSVVAGIGRAEIYDYVDALFTVYLVLIFIRILLTWVPRMPYNPYLRAAVSFVERTTDPYLNIFRAILRPVGFGGMALDFSPIVAIVVLYVVRGLVLSAIGGG